MFLHSTPSPLLSSLLSNMAHENEEALLRNAFNAEPAIVEFDFLLTEREEMSRRISSMVRTRTARRVATMMLPPTELPNNLFANTPTGRPALERQNAIVAPAALTPVMLNFPLTTAAAPQDFLCAICLDDEDVGETVVHPRNCHVFHRTCLNRAMNSSQNCPMCRRTYDFYFI